MWRIQTKLYRNAVLSVPLCCPANYFSSCVSTYIHSFFTDNVCRLAVDNCLSVWTKLQRTQQKLDSICRPQSLDSPQPITITGYAILFPRRQRATTASAWRQLGVPSCTSASVCPWYQGATLAKKLLNSL